MKLGTCENCGKPDVWINELWAVFMDGNKFEVRQCCQKCFDKKGPLRRQVLGPSGPEDTNPIWDNVTRAYEEDR